MATVKLKDESERIDFQGRRETITSNNLNFEKYEQLMKDFPQLKEKFEVIEDSAPAKTKKSE